MARRARQGSMARCPYCEAYLPMVAAECPECRFPLTMAAVDGGFSTAEPSGTTSTATPGGRSARPVVAGSGGGGWPSVHGDRVQRMRITAWLLGVTTVLLLIAGLGAVFTASSPGVRSDAEAKVNLLTALHRVTDDPGHRQDVLITELGPGSPSASPLEVSIDRADGLWFAAARSTSGSCWLLAARLANGEVVGQGSLRKGDPCTGARVRSRSEEALANARR